MEKIINDAKIHDLPNSCNKNDKAYLTVLSDCTYLSGVLALHKSLLKTGTKIPFVCVVNNSIFDQVVKSLDDENIVIKCKEDIVFNTEDLNGDDSSWNKTFFKFRIFELDEYDKCVYLDSDMIVLKNIDELFEYPNFSAVKDDYQFTMKKWDGKLNSGTLVFCPDKNVCFELINIAKCVIADYRTQGKAVGDQDILSEYLSEWSDNETLHLSEIYNCAINMIEKQHRIGKSNYKYSEIKVIHFVGGYKPWINNNCIKYFFERIFKFKYFESYCFLKFFIFSK